jgi:hypothetical protein
VSCRISERVFVRRSSTRVAHFSTSLPGDLVDVLWEQPTTLVDAGEVLNSRNVRRTVKLHWAGCWYVLKHYVEPSFSYALKHSFQPSRAWHAWKATHVLADAGIATPRAVACIENPWGQLRRDSFMMYPYVEGHTLTTYFGSGVGTPAPQQVWAELRVLWQRLGQLRVSLADTNVRNFILCPAGRLWIIDLDTTRFHWSTWATAHYHRRSWARLVRTAQLTRQQAA